MKTEIETVNHIVNEYLKWKSWVVEQNFDLDDIQLYQIWAEETAKEINLFHQHDEKIKEDLIALCEDNENMKEAITGYFNEKE